MIKFIQAFLRCGDRLQPLQNKFILIFSYETMLRKTSKLTVKPLHVICLQYFQFLQLDQVNCCYFSKHLHLG